MRFCGEGDGEECDGEVYVYDMGNGRGGGRDGGMVEYGVIWGVGGVM